MKESINLPKLINILADKAGCDPAEARRFLHHFFGIIEEGLLNGENVIVKGVGEFRSVDDPAQPVKFMADPILASIANEPFAAFSAVELNDGVTESELNLIDEEKDEKPREITPQPEETSTTVTRIEPEPDTAYESEPESISQKEHIESVAEYDVSMSTEQQAVIPDDTVTTAMDETGPSMSNEPAEPVMTVTPQQPLEPKLQSDCEPVTSYPEPEIRYVEIEHSGRNKLWLLIGILIGLIIGLIAGFFAGKAISQYQLPEDTTIGESLSEETTTEDLEDPYLTITESSVPVDVQADETPAPAEISSSASAEPPSQDQPIYDTVSRSRYLTTMARDHYGVKKYWIFIYNANPSLGNPNQIAPGTRVLIPAKESFAGSTEKETDAKAQALLNELSRKYKL
ncbi:MAG: HU family DNA-binding protein [Odoribacter sp.]|nr:HU family DNA-binding protein [Odoribacter sp.]